MEHGNILEGYINVFFQTNPQTYTYRVVVMEECSKGNQDTLPKYMKQIGCFFSALFSFVLMMIKKYQIVHQVFLFYLLLDRSIIGKISSNIYHKTMSN